MDALPIEKYDPTQVHIELGNPSSTDARDDGYVDIRVVDDASGETIVWTQLPAGRFYRLIQGGSQHVSAVLTRHPERFGRQLITKVTPLPDDYHQGEEADQRRDRWNALQDLGRTDDPAWFDASVDDTSARRSNRGVEMIARRWTPTD